MKVGKCIMLGILVFLIGASVLTASETRIVTMGYNANFYIRDSYNIWDFPSTIVNYQNMVFAESESPDDNALWRGGIHIPLSPSVIVGVYTSSEKTDLEIEETPYPDTYTLGHIADHQYDVFVGMDGVNTDFGLHLQMFSSKIEYTNPADADTNWSEKLGWVAFAGGVSHKMSPQTRLDAAIHYTSGSFASIDNTQDPVQKMEPYKYSSWGIGVRLFHALSPKSIVVPFVAYGSGGEGYQWLLAEEDNPDPFEPKAARLGMSGYIVGTAIEFMPNNKNLITLAGGVEGNSYEPEIVLYPNQGSVGVLPKWSSMVFPFISIGLESRIAKWLDARFSFYELLWSEKYSNPVSETQLDELKTTGSFYEANFGLAFHLGQFDIDVLVDTNYFADFLHNGPYILSGNYKGDLFSQISVTYTFPKDEQK